MMCTNDKVVHLCNTTQSVTRNAQQRIDTQIHTKNTNKKAYHPGAPIARVLIHRYTQTKQTNKPTIQALQLQGY